MPSVLGIFPFVHAAKKNWLEFFALYDINVCLPLVKGSKNKAQNFAALRIVPAVVLLSVKLRENNFHQNI